MEWPTGEQNEGNGSSNTLAAAGFAARKLPCLRRETNRRRARILVVDDDRDVRQTTGEMLTERGYSVELAADADEALAILRRDGGFHAMLVDYVMPGINGASLVKMVRSLRPGLHSLMTTGHAELQAGEEIGTENTIRKPLSVAMLDERLARLLAGPILRVVQGEVRAGIILNRLVVPSNTEAAG